MTGEAKLRRDRALEQLAATTRNEDMPAGSPMHFACTECGATIWVPEMYLAKPRRCPDCGGEWSRPS